MTTGGDTNKPTLPVHLGLILDGNRRWAKDNGLPTLEGHKRGYEVLKTIGDAVIARGIKYVTVYAFSTENWQRPASEVKFLMDMLYWVATHEIESFHKKNIKLVFLGKDQPIPERTMKVVMAAEEKTKHNTAGTLAICINYGGQAEIADACRKVIQAGIKPQDVTPELIRQNLYHPEIPDVDLIIRTSGEQRLSNFMLWRAAYSELYFLAEKHWPDFTADDLDKALADYAQRVRRFGQ